jgi:excisionase family DNA binding protein
MPIVIAGETYYRTAEVCRLIGVSRNTLFRWLKEGKFGQQEYRDWRGWRLFTREQVSSARAATGQVKVVELTG